MLSKTQLEVFADPGVDSATAGEDWDVSNGTNDTVYGYSTEVRILFDIPSAILIYYGKAVSTDVSSFDARCTLSNSISRTSRSPRMMNQMMKTCSMKTELRYD
jgi:hypothetical protein